MSKWKQVGEWLSENVDGGVALVGSLLTGNIPGAIAAGASMVSNATGTSDPVKALAKLKAEPKLLIELERIKNERAAEVNRHIEAIELAELEDKQHEHEQTQLTVRNADNAEGNVKWVRPAHATVSLIASMFYVFLNESPDVTILSALLALPFSYSGLRQIGKWRTKQI